MTDRALRRAVRATLIAAAAWLAVILGTGPLAGDLRAFWTTLGFLASLALPIWCCIRRNDERDGAIDWLQPGSVLAGLFYFYYVIPALHVWLDFDYQSAWLDPIRPAAPLFQFTFVLCLLGLVGFSLGYRLNAPRSLRTPPTLEAIAARWPPRATAAAVAMLGIGLPFRLYHLAAYGGLTPDLLLFLSPSYQVESGVTIGGIPTLLETFFDWGALLLLLRAIITRKQVLVALTILAVAIVLAYLEGGKRSAIVPFLFFPVVWLHYLRRRLTLKRTLLYGGAGATVITILLFVRTLGPTLAKDVIGSDIRATVALEPVRFYLASPELAVFDMTMLGVQDRAPLLKEVGGPFWGALQHNLAPLGYMVPRFVWPGKPVYTELGQVFYQRADGSSPDVGFNVGIVGGWYLFGGLAGVLLGMAAVGASFRLLYLWLRPWSRDPQRVFLYGIALWMVFQFLRFGTMGFTFLYIIQFELPGIAVALLTLRLRRDVAAIT